MLGVSAVQWGDLAILVDPDQGVFTLQLELCSLTAKSLTAVFFAVWLFFFAVWLPDLQSGSVVLQSGSALAVWLAKKSQTATKKSQTAKTTEPDCKPKRQKGEKGGQKQPKTARLQPNTEPDCKKSFQPDCSQIPFLPSQTAEQSQTAAPVPPPGCSGTGGICMRPFGNKAHLRSELRAGDSGRSAGASPRFIDVPVFYQ